MKLKKKRKTIPRREKWNRFWIILGKILENTFENFINLDIFEKIRKSIKIRTCYVFHFCCNVRWNYFCHHFICIIICHSEMETRQQWRRICSQVSLENLKCIGDSLRWRFSVTIFAFWSKTFSIHFNCHKQPNDIISICKYVTHI